MSKEKNKDDPRWKSDHGSFRQTDEPWKGNPEKEQRDDDTKIDLEKWHRANTHGLGYMDTGMGLAQYQIVAQGDEWGVLAKRIFRCPPHRVIANRDLLPPN